MHALSLVVVHLDMKIDQNVSSSVPAERRNVSRTISVKLLYTAAQTNLQYVSIKLSRCAFGYKN